ncbi:hypothetical protein BVY03_01255 [bacterium K02(2017)]|nr:hypothetical protein BVY03_01255 [bacterium K02(2017)]
MSTPVNAAASSVGLLSGGSLVGPVVFETAQKIAQKHNNVTDQLNYAKEMADANKHNLEKLRYSQQMPLVPLRLKIPAPFKPISRVTTPDLDRIADFDIYHARNRQRANWNPKDIVRSKDDTTPSTDPAVEGAYNSMVNSLWYFLEGLGFNSIDAKGMAIKAAVHIGKNYNNAFYTNGTINLGDGDGKIFHKFAEDLTVIAHELGHGVVEMILGGLTYWSQSGALNESMADILGASALQFAMGQTANEADWLIGKLAMVPYTDDNGKLIDPSLRSMKAPGTAYVNHPRIGTDSQPADMDDYYSGSRDNYGVHINSGIPNRAFYLAATQVGGFSHEVVLPVWLDATKAISKNANFKTFANETLKSAEKLFPGRPEVKAAIKAAWETVKVLGSTVVDKEPKAYRLIDPDLLDAFEIDTNEYSRLRIQLDGSPISIAPGVSRASVGFELNDKSEAKLVVLVFVDKDNPPQNLPPIFEGYKVVEMDKTGLQDQAIDELHDDHH